MGQASPREQSGVELALRRDVDAPGIARTAVAELCHELELEGRPLQTLILLVSEVVSNAVLHSAAPDDEEIGFAVAVYDGTVRVTVTDGGDGFVPCERDPHRIEGGYGLYLLEKAATRWGVDCGASTSVWFELDVAD